MTESKSAPSLYSRIERAIRDNVRHDIDGEMYGEGEAASRIMALIRQEQERAPSTAGVAEDSPSNLSQDEVDELIGEFHAPSAAGVADLSETAKRIAWILYRHNVAHLVGEGPDSHWEGLTERSRERYLAAAEAARALTPPSAPNDAVREALEAVRAFATGIPAHWSDAETICIGIPEGEPEPKNSDDPSPLTIGHLRALSALSRPAGEGAWRPIEELPKMDRVIVGRWVTDFTNPFWVQCEAHWFDLDGKEWAFGGDRSTYLTNETPPTHFFRLNPPSLLAPPSTTSAEG